MRTAKKEIDDGLRLSEARWRSASRIGAFVRSAVPRPLDSLSESASVPSLRLSSHCCPQAVPNMNEPRVARTLSGCQKYVLTATKSAIHVTTSPVELHWQGAESAVSNPFTQLTAAAVPILLLTYQISIHFKIFLKQTAMNSTLPGVPSSAPRFSAISRSAHHDPSGSPNRSKTVVSSPDAPSGSHSL